MALVAVVSAILALAGAQTQGNWSSTLPYRTKARQWNDARAFLSVLVPGPRSCNAAGFGSSGAARLWACAEGESLDGTIQLPHSYAEQGDLGLHIYWTAADQQAGMVRWGADYHWLEEGAVAAAPVTVTTGDVAAPKTAWRLVRSDFSPRLSGAGHKISGILVLRVFRQAAGGAEYRGRASVAGVSAHFPMDSLGSGEEGLK